MKKSWLDLAIAETTLVNPELQIIQHVKCGFDEIKKKKFCKRNSIKKLDSKGKEKY